jgi:hypothetical protein
MVSECIAVILLFTYFVPLVTTKSAGCFAAVSISLLSTYLKFLVTSNSAGFSAAVSVEHWLLSGNISTPHAGCLSSNRASAVSLLHL